MLAAYCATINLQSDTLGTTKVRLQQSMKSVLRNLNNKTMANITKAKQPGLSKKIKSPDELLKLFFAYVDATKKNPIIKQDYVGRTGKEVRRQIERPLTMVGFELYCSQRKVISGLKNYFANTRGAYNAYYTICSRIRLEIRQDQIVGGMIGIYNASITQRLNSLVDKIEDNRQAQRLFK